MKKLILYIAAALLTLVSCAKSDGTAVFPKHDGRGTLDLRDLLISSEGGATDNYIVELVAEDQTKVFSQTYASLVAHADSIRIAAGHYTLSAASAAQIPAAAFEAPAFVGSKALEVKADETLTAGEVVCRELQAEVEVEYSPDFLAVLQSDAVATVAINPDFPLAYTLKYNDGKPVREERTGYFVVNNGETTTMEVRFKGRAGGQDLDLVKLFTGVEACKHYKVRFAGKSISGVTDVVIFIEDFVDDEPLTNKQ